MARQCTTIDAFQSLFEFETGNKCAELSLLQLIQLAQLDHLLTILSMSEFVFRILDCTSSIVSLCFALKPLLCFDLRKLEPTNNENLLLCRANKLGYTRWRQTRSFSNFSSTRSVVKRFLMYKQRCSWWPG